MDPPPIDPPPSRPPPPTLQYATPRASSERMPWWMIAATTLYCLIVGWLALWSVATILRGFGCAGVLTLVVAAVAARVEWSVIKGDDDVAGEAGVSLVVLSILLGIAAFFVYAGSSQASGRLIAEMLGLAVALAFVGHSHLSYARFLAARYAVDAS